MSIAFDRRWPARAIPFKPGAAEVGKRSGVMPSFKATWSQQLPRVDKGLELIAPPVAGTRQGARPIPRAGGSIASGRTPRPTGR